MFTVADGEQIFAAVSDAVVLRCPGCSTQGRSGPAEQSRVVLLPAAPPGCSRADELPRRWNVRAFAPIRKPEDLYDDPHLNATGGLADVRLPDGDKAGETVKTTLLPFTMAGSRLGVRLDPPRLGEHTRALLSALGLAQADIVALYEQRAVA
jgi:hypothetical protein